MPTATENNHIFFEVNAFFAQMIQDLIDIPASVILGQSFLESGQGTSELASRYNNLFGVKGEGDAGSVTLPTREYIGGEWIDTEAEFARYSSPLESFRDYGDFLQRNPRYSEAFGLGDPYLTIDTIAGAGYATDPSYSQKVKDIIDRYNLTQYDSSPVITYNISDFLPEMGETVTESVFGNPLDGESWREKAYERAEALNPPTDLDAVRETISDLNPFKNAGENIARGVVVLLIIIVLLVLVFMMLPKPPHIQAAANLVKGG